MKLSSFAITAIVVIGLLALSMGIASANIIAYNDCVVTSINCKWNNAGAWTSMGWDYPVPGVNYTGTSDTVGMWGNLPAYPAAWSSSELIDFNTGLGTGVTATWTSASSRPECNPTIPQYGWESTSYSPPSTLPNCGYDFAQTTDGGKIFNPWTASVRGLQQGLAGTWFTQVTLSGLNPNKTYEFVTTTDRANPNYTTRCVMYSIIGANSWTNTSSTPYATADGSKVALYTGNNVNGLVGRWTFKPAVDGTVSFKASTAAGTTFIPALPITPSGTAGMSVFRLKELSDSKVSGTVKDAAGKPIAGALVVLSTRTNALADPDYLQTLTDESGNYQITDVNTGSYNMAAWKMGYRVSGETVVAIASNTDTKTANFTLTQATLNKAIVATASSNNASPYFSPNLAIDDSAGVSPLEQISLDDSFVGNGSTKNGTLDPGTGFFSLTTCFPQQGGAVNAVNVMPTQLLIDCGKNVNASEMVVYWAWTWARGYKIQCMTDSSDRNTAVDSPDWDNSAIAKTLYSTDKGRPGRLYPVPGNVPPRTLTVCYPYDPDYYVDVYKFSEVSARYWRILATNAVNRPYVGIQEVELHDTTTFGTIAKNIGDVKKATDGSYAMLSGMYFTAGSDSTLPANTMYVESPNRAGGIRLDITNTPITATFGESVDVVGVIKTTAAGEKYIEATRASKISSNVIAPDAIGMNNRDAAKAKGMFVKTWGNVSSTGDDYFVISDGSAAPIKVMCGALNKPTSGTVRVRGVMSVDSSGPVLYMRNEQADWTNGSDTYQPLPFPGPYKYRREFLIIGPFADDKSLNGDPSATPPQTAQEYRYYHDFLSDASGGTITESNVRPSAGDACGSYNWKRWISGADSINFITAFPTNNTNCTFYAHLYVWLPYEPMFGVTMRIGSDDSGKMFVNGVEKYGALASRGLIIGQDLVQMVPLHQGLNSLLFKIEQGTTASGLNIQFVDDDNWGSGDSGYGGAHPLPGIGYVLNKVP